MSRTARFIDIHVLQPVPYSNLNRDDTNSVKTVLYGDTLRTRVSSQSWKRAVRNHFQEAMDGKALRTRRIGEQVAEVLRRRGWDEERAARAGAHVAAGSSIKYEVAKDSKVKPIKNKVLTNALIYLPEAAVETLADLCERHADAIKDDFGDKNTKKPTSGLPQKEIDEIFREKNGVIRLFGRMLAEVDHADVDGAVQVAHAFTTHTTEVELDYFAAVDDVTEARDDETGSGHMGTGEFSAGTFYRFATVDLAELAKNLEEDQTAARDLVRQFLLSFIGSLPQAKKNSTAPHTPPHLVHLAVRDDRPLSFAGAFERPVRSGEDGGFSRQSAVCLDEYAHTVNTLMGSGHVLHATRAGVDVDETEHLGEQHTDFAALVDAVVNAAVPAEARQ